MAKVYATSDTDGRSTPTTPPSIRHSRRAHRQLMLVWTIAVAVPWILQIAGFSQLAVRHKITQSLVPPPDSPKRTENITTRCSVDGLHIAGTWWNINPTHYYESRGDFGHDGVLCYFIIPQYNIHGAYNVQWHKTPPISEVPTECANDSYATNYYFYHGSIGYYSFYEEGEGSYCTHDHTAYFVVSGVGSSDINFNALAKFEGSSGYRVSYYFGVVGCIWLVYRTAVLARSYVSCSQYGSRLDKLHQPLSISSAIVFIQHASRITPHNATNWHRLGLLYLLVEGLMTDLFLLIARDGFAAKLQYISLGYNIAGVLSMLFEIVESLHVLRPSWHLLIKRLLFNTELAFWGELLFAVVMQYYLTALNKSSLRHSLSAADAVSYYVWGLVGHAVIVLGQTAFILAVRATVSMVYIMWRFRSLRVLTAPCCVDSVMSYRSKITKITGYVFKDQKLYYTRNSLKAHGLLKMTDIEGKEFLVYHKIHWFPSSSEDLAVVGSLSSEHVESCNEAPCTGTVAVCDRKLGGTATTSLESDIADSVGLLHEEFESSV